MVKFTKEEWKQIPEYLDYWVSNLGRTKSLEKRVETQQLIIQEVLKKFDNSY